VKFTFETGKLSGSARRVEPSNIVVGNTVSFVFKGKPSTSTGT
jgi:hypothetical protein